MAVPTISEISLLQRLRPAIQGLELPEKFLEDKNLVRWLRARKNNLKNTEEMIRKHQEWYLKNNIKNLMESFGVKEEWETDFPYYISGFDKTGSPVGVAELGKWDVQKVMASGDRLNFLRFALQKVHFVWNVCRKQSEGRNYMSQFVGIYDFKGLALRQVTSYEVMELTATVIQIFEANYPETLKRGFIINAPWAFQILWKLIRPFVDQRTHDKLVFLGSNPKTWRDEISQLVPLDQFPQSYGGMREDTCPKVTVNKQNGQLCFI